MQNLNKTELMCFDFVTIEYIKWKLDKYGMSKIDLARFLGLKHQNLYSLLNGKRRLTNWHQAAIYYFFKSLKS